MLRAAYALTVSLCLAVLAWPALGADRDVPMAVKAPLAASSGPAWSGFYFGGHVGYAFGSSRYFFNEGSDIDSTDLFGSRGFSAGALAGFNLIAGRRWLLGVETDWSGQNVETTIVGSVVVKQSWAASVRGRLGYLVTPETLVFGSAGWAWSDVDLTVGGLSLSSSSAVDGFQGGVGIETATAMNWHLRLEYLHTFYRTASLNPAVASLLELPGIRPSVGLGRAALIYQFGSGAGSQPAWPASAVAAPTWTGFYLGGAIGGTVAYADIAVAGAGVNGAGLAGPLPSVFAGVNYQFAPRWLVGAEAEIAPSVRSTDLKLGWIGAVRARFGYLLMPDTLLYATAGWIGTQIDDLVDRGSVIFAGQRINGVQVGGGIEAAFAGHWSTRFDYQYAIMEKVDLAFPLAPGLTVAVSEPRGHTGRIAIVRRFGG